MGEKNTLSPVTACISAHYITKGCYDFRFLKELCNNQLQAGMRLYIIIAAIFRFHRIRKNTSDSVTANCSSNTVGLFKLTRWGKILMYCLFVSVFLVGGLRSFGVFLQSIC